MVAQQQQTPKDTRIDDGLGFFFLYVIALYCIRRLTKTKCSSNGPRRRREGLPHLHPQHHGEISQGSFFFHDCESSEAGRERDSPSDFSELITQMRAYQRPYKLTRQAAASNTLYIVKRKIKPWKLNWKLEKMASLHLPDSRGRPAAIKFNYAIQPARAQSISKLAAQQQSQQNTLHCWSNWKNKHAPSA